MLFRSGDRDVFVEDRLFATLDTLTREVVLGERQRVLLTDTVGFIRKLPHHLVASFRATLEEVTEADLLLHVIDVSHPAWEDQRDVVDQVLAELGAHDKPVLYVFNKSDLLSPGERAGLAARMQALLPGSVLVSARTEHGTDTLHAALSERLLRQRPATELRVSAGNGKLLAEIHRTGEVIEQRSDGEEMVLVARVDAVALARLQRAGAVVGTP